MFKKDTSKSKEEDNQSATTKIIILGGGFAGIEVLKRVQNKFRNKKISRLP